jgi:hypothetical protein
VKSLSALQSLRQVKTLRDMAHLLGYQPSGLSYLLYKLPAGSKYTTFALPKKGGGVRQIDAPAPRIKLVPSDLEAKIKEMLAKAILADVSGGKPGAKGIAGKPGSGGKFGYGGRGATGCDGREQQRKGRDGANGQPAADGHDGHAGADGKVVVDTNH